MCSVKGLTRMLPEESGPNVDQDISAFKEELASHSALDIVRSNIISGECSCLEHDKYYDLRNVVSDHFDVHPNEVILVGSAKLGFSIAPHKEFRPFGDNSDLDVAIISPRLFDTFWVQLFDYSRSGALWEKLDDFEQFLFRGWIRPDLFPREISLASDWWDFFLGLTRSGQYRYQVRGALYRSWHCIECYHVERVEEMQLHTGGNR